MLSLPLWVRQPPDHRPNLVKERERSEGPLPIHNASADQQTEEAGHGETAATGDGARQLQAGSVEVDGHLLGIGAAPWSAALRFLVFHTSIIPVKKRKETNITGLEPLQNGYNYSVGR